MIFHEDTIHRIAKFYNETKTWRGELILAGCNIRADVVGHHHPWTICEVRDNPRKIGFYVKINRKGNLIVEDFRHFSPHGPRQCKDVDEVMDHISEKLRDG